MSSLSVSLSSPQLARFVRYLMLGGLATGLNWASRLWLWSRLLPFNLAVIAAYATGMLLGFELYRRFVFPASPQPLAVQVRTFVLVNMVGLSLTWTVAIALVDWLFPRVGFGFHPQAVGHAVALAASVMANWALHSRFTFAQAPRQITR